MSKLQSFKRIIMEDFDSKDRDLVSKLAYSINTFADDVLSAFNNAITIEDNLNIAKKDFTVVVDSTGKPTTSGALKTNLNHTCEGVMVIRVVDLTSPNTYLSGTPMVSFSENSGILSIQNITNLTASHQYRLKLLLF